MNNKVEKKIDTGKWYRVAANYDFTLGRARLYIDGAKRGEKTFTPGMMIHSKGHIRLGGFLGDVSCLQVFDRALTSHEIEDFRKCPLSRFTTFYFKKLENK